ncbi:TonB-dependent receptor [Prevotella sp. HUN102]|uniref:TonB-dependent receptor n=1 Tax=Prevotella sp. HUN102 TaxID=1392486 RepID=UPI0006906619|nr:TonB-dependent receptor [Prevotella sp. HUN102]
MKKKKRGFIAIILLLLMSIQANAQEIAGNVYEAKTNAPVIGATIESADGKPLAVTDIDGDFVITGLENQTYSIVVRYIGYKTKRIDGVKAQPSGADNVVKIAMEVDDQQLQEVQVTAVARRNTEQAMIQITKNSDAIVSNISAQEISKTQDSNAGEVIRRVPGVSLIEDKFVMVRGLSQRYNNVWINGGAVPSSEADSRAFSFDIIPSSQIDNLTIVKMPSPEYPADYSGGFIIVNTKEIPSENSLSLMLGGNWNTQTAFQDFNSYKGSGTDFLGFDGGKRSLGNGISTRMNLLPNGGTDLLGNGLNNDWTTKKHTPLADLKLSLNWNRRWNVGEHRLGMIAMVNYSNEYRTYEDMQNNLFGIYDAQNDRENYLRHSVDDQYNHNVRLGAMLNLPLLTANGLNKFQFKNIVNQIGSSRYTWREGVSAQSNMEHSAEYYYRSRTTYNGQITGKHTLPNDELDWNVDYAYANRLIPDRRRYLIDDATETGQLALTTGNDMSRE